MKNKFISRVLILVFFTLLASCKVAEKSLYVKSKGDSNQITLSLNKDGALYYKVTRGDKIIIQDSPLGLKCDDQDFTSGLSVAGISPVEEKKEQYELKVSNYKKIDHVFERKSITFKNSQGALMIIDLAAGNEGVAFRYRFPDTEKKTRKVETELTGFHIEQNAKGWLQPYNKAGDYTPGYEDFYVNVKSGDPVSGERNPSVGWCMPALFNVNDAKNWVLIAESGNEGSYPGCHLQPESAGGMYKVAFAENDEKYTLPLADKTNNWAQSNLPWVMPWRVIIIGDNAGDILLSTLITDLAPASKIVDTSWIEPGKAGWSWWSHPDDHSPEIYKNLQIYQPHLVLNTHFLMQVGKKRTVKEKLLTMQLPKGLSH